jgi:hypothetical protein
MPLNIIIASLLPGMALDPDALNILSWSLIDFNHITDFTPKQYQQIHKKVLHLLNELIKAIHAGLGLHWAFKAPVPAKMIP